MSFFEEDREQAELGNPIGQFNLGLAYWKGDGVNKDFKEAESWLTKAAQQDYVEAFSSLGGLYLQMERLQKAIEYFQLAVDKESPTAECLLGQLYYDSPYIGYGIDKDYKKAFELFTKAASRILTSGSNVSTAQCKLGLMYINGQGTETNYEDGLIWLERSAAHGNAEAEHSIGIVYRNGVGVEQDFNEALSWFVKAADKNYAPAQYSIGSLYLNGEGGIAKDIETSVIWIKKAAENGYYLAQSQLGFFYSDGKGVKQDDDQAILWLEKAGAQGHLQSSKRVGRLHLKQENFKGAAFFLQLSSQMGDQEAEELCKKHELWNFKFE